MYTRWERRLLVGSLLLSDTLGLTVALALAYYLRLESGLLYYAIEYDPVAYVRIAILALPIWLIIFAWNRLYDSYYLLGGPQEYARAVGACTYGMVILMVIDFFLRRGVISRGWLLMAWPLTILCVGGMRFLLRRVFFVLRRRGLFVTRTLIVGTSEHARTIASQYFPATTSGVEVAGFLDDFLPIDTHVVQELRVLGTPDDLIAVAQREGVKQAIVVSNAIAWESFQELISSMNQASNGLDIQISPGFYEILSTGARMTHRGYVPVLVVDRVRIIGLDAWLKRTLDFGLLLGTLPLWMPLIGSLALIARVLSPGPVFNSRPVLGRQGHAFITWVFHVGCDGTSPTSLRGRANEAFRRFLHESGFSKLPQFFNVLLLQMSLVGPRPVSARPPEALRPWLPNLLTVRPGVTGPWIIAGDESLEEEMRANVYYIRNYAIWLDIQILFRTMLRVIRRQRRQRPVTVEEGEIPSDPAARAAPDGTIWAEGQMGSSTLQHK